MVLQVRSGAKPTTRCAHECVYASQVQPWLESSTTRILQRKRANGCELVHTCLVGWRFRDHEDGKKQNFEAHQAAGNEHLRFLVVAGPKAHTSRMRNLTITALLLLSCCARFDEAKEREGCQKAHPNDQVAADKCFETSILEWEKAHAWVARITHRRPETP